MKIWIAGELCAQYISVLFLLGVSLSLVFSKVYLRTSVNLNVLIDGFKFSISNRIFSTLSDVILHQLIPHLSLTPGGPTRYRQFIENSNDLVLCTGNTFKKAQELTVLPGSIQTVFELKSRGMVVTGKRVWSIFLRLDIDNSSYEDLGVQEAQEKLEIERREAQVEEIQRQTRSARMAQERARRERMQETITEGRRITRQWDEESVRTISFLNVFHLIYSIFLKNLS
jgi:hypothetical protein